jgi:hypothetical protein
MIPENLHRYIIEWKPTPTSRHSKFWEVFAKTNDAAQNYADKAVNRETFGDGIIIAVTEVPSC